MNDNNKVVIYLMETLDNLITSPKHWMSNQTHAEIIFSLNELLKIAPIKKKDSINELIELWKDKHYITNTIKLTIADLKPLLDLLLVKYAKSNKLKIKYISPLSSDDINNDIEQKKHKAIDGMLRNRASLYGFQSGYGW